MLGVVILQGSQKLPVKEATFPSGTVWRPLTSIVETNYIHTVIKKPLRLLLETRVLTWLYAPTTFNFSDLHVYIEGSACFMLKSIPIQQFNPPEPPLFLQYFWVDFFANFKSRDLFVCLPQAVMGHSIFTFAPYRGKISNTFKTSMVQASLIEMASSRPAPCLKVNMTVGYPIPQQGSSSLTGMKLHKLHPQSLAWWSLLRAWYLATSSFTHSSIHSFIHPKYH